MFDVIGENLGVLFGLLVVMWILQFGLTYFQMRKYTKRLKVIRQDGLTAVGMSGSRYKGRTYGILTIDDNNQIIHAEKMSGWTNFSNLRPVPDLVGMNVEQILMKKLNLRFQRNYISPFEMPRMICLKQKKEKQLITILHPL